MDPETVSVILGLTATEFFRLVVTRKKIARKNAIRKIKRHSSTAKYAVDKASIRHLENVDRLLDK